MERLLWVQKGSHSLYGAICVGEETGARQPECLKGWSHCCGGIVLTEFKRGAIAFIEPLVWGIV